MEIQVLMSTMKRANISDLKLSERNINHNVLIINQTDNNDVYVNNECNIRMLNSNTIGTSNSRNMAIRNADGEICIFADDDIQYVADYEHIVSSAFRDNPTADIITFQIMTPDGSPFKKNYMKSSISHNLRTVLKCASIEIAFRRKSIIDSQLWLDLEFGLGSRYRIHDDVIFLADAIRKGLKVKYVPVPIVIHPKESSGTMYNDFLITSKGAAFYRIYGRLGYMLNIVYAFKKYPEYKNTYSIMSFVILMFKGSREFQKTHKK